MVPAYNAAITIVDTLNSVAAQTYRPIQLIIINDGSTDQTGQVVRKWIDAFCGVNLEVCYHVQPNQGLLRCRQLGVELSKGSYLQFLDADDLIHCEKIARCVNVLATGAWDLAVSRTEKFFESSAIGARLTSQPQTRRWTSKELRNVTITNGWWHSVGPLFTRAIVRAAGDFPVDVHPVAEELEFHGRIKLTTKRICYLDEVLNFYRTGHPSLTRPLRYLYEGRIRGAAMACALLTEHRVTSFREWFSVLRMSVRTYYQVVNCCPEPDLKDQAWKSLRETARCCNLAMGLATGLAPRQLIDRMCRGAYAVRSRQLAYMSSASATGVQQ